jgi:3-oxoacyl-[acyl-carrier protein] reductase
MNILITGGASGLGETITRYLLKNKSNKVFFTYANSKHNANLICKDFKNSKSIFCNFKDIKSVNNLCEILSTLDLDILINNAYTGKAIHKQFNKTPSDVFKSDFINNVLPTILISQSAISHFKKRKFGKIITVLTSFLVNSPPIGSSCYVANKAYLRSLTKSWANENIKFNITSNTISPSFMQTNLNSSVDSRIIDQIVKDHPLNRILLTEEVAETVGFLVNASQQINGVNLIINSGKNII